MALPEFLHFFSDGYNPPDRYRLTQTNAPCRTEHKINLFLLTMNKANFSLRMTGLRINAMIFSLSALKTNFRQ